MKLSEKELISLSRLMGLPLKQHHVVVYADGSVYFRADTPIPEGDWRIRDIAWHHHRIMYFTLEPYVLGVSPVRGHLYPGPKGKGRYMRSSFLARKLVRRGSRQSRLRITKVTRFGPDGSFRMWLKVIPVTDMYSIWQDMNHKLHGNSKLTRKK